MYLRLWTTLDTMSLLVLVLVAGIATSLESRFSISSPIVHWVAKTLEGAFDVVDRICANKPIAIAIVLSCLQRNVLSHKLCPQVRLAKAIQRSRRLKKMWIVTTLSSLLETLQLTDNELAGVAGDLKSDECL